MKFYQKGKEMEEDRAWWGQLWMAKNHYLIFYFQIILSGCNSYKWQLKLLILTLIFQRVPNKLKVMIKMMECHHAKQNLSIKCKPPPSVLKGQYQFGCKTKLPSKTKLKIHACFSGCFKFWRYFLQKVARFRSSFISCRLTPKIRYAWWNFLLMLPWLVVPW